MLPNDENEQERLDIHHVLCKQTLHGKLLLAPIQSPQRVLDLGTGTGIWAIEFGTYPLAQADFQDDLCISTEVLSQRSNMHLPK